MPAVSTMMSTWTQMVVAGTGTAVAVMTWSCECGTREGECTNERDEQFLVVHITPNFLLGGC